MTRKMLCLILSTFMLAGALFATGQQDDTVTLRIDTWENPSTTEALTELNAKFMEAYPNIKVELTTSPTDQFQTSNPLRIQAADVDIWSGFGFAQKAQDFHGDVVPAAAYQNIEAGLVEPLDGQAFMNNYKQDAVKEFMTYNGKPYGVCMGSVVISGIFWNRDLFKENGLSQPQTYDELVNASETLQAAGYTAFTAAGGPVWPINMVNVGFIGAMYDDVNELEESLWTGGKGFEDPRYIEALKRYQNLMTKYYEPGFQTIDYNPHVGRFATGRIGMLPDGIWMANGIADAIKEAGTDFDFGYMQVPASDDKAANQTYYGKGDLMWFVHSKSENKEAAMLWLEFMSKPENYTYFVNKVGWLPTQDVTVESRILDEVSKYPMKLSFEQVHISREGQGEMAGGLVQFLTPMGTIESAEEYAAKAMADWNAAE
ncbi:MAG: extracellular solute-binding protein [Spirochaetaceae bacterium]|nr:extracellular solute-binding protein [Spirochaetaceae bacterium]